MKGTMSPYHAPMSRGPASLTRDRDFRVFWFGRAVSDLGDQITLVALPLTAIATLQASAAQIGILTALALAPNLLFSLIAGVWVDRLRRRPILIWTDLGRAVLLMWIPAAYLLGALRIEQLYAIAFATGVLSVLSFVAYQAYLPSLVGRDHIVEANGRILSTQSAAQVAGPGVSGVLVQILTAPLPIVLDAISFVVCATTVWFIRRPEPAPSVERRAGMLREISEGMRALFGHPVLRALVVTASLVLTAVGAQQAVFVLFMARDLALTPATIGFILAMQSVGAVVGALCAARTARAFGLGPSILASTLVVALGFAARGLVSGTAGVDLAILSAAQLGLGFASAVFNVNGPSLRQALTPHRLLGRVNASYRFAAWGVTPIGALVGGLVAQAFGVRAALLTSAVWMILPLAFVALSPLRSVRDVPASATATA